MSLGFKSRINKYIKTWDTRLPGGIPDECHPDIERNRLSPSYRQIVIAIIKNDYALKSLGQERIKCDAYNELKRIELLGRQKYQTQLKLKL